MAVNHLVTTVAALFWISLSVARAGKTHLSSVYLFYIYLIRRVHVLFGYLPPRPGECPFRFSNAFVRLYPNTHRHPDITDGFFEIDFELLLSFFFFGSFQNNTQQQQQQNHLVIVNVRKKEKRKKYSTSMECLQAMARSSSSS